MKNTTEKQFAHTVLATSIAAIGFSVAPVALADSPADVTRYTSQPASEIEMGISDTSSDSFKFGDYRGLENSGAHLIANVQMARYSDDKAGYLEIIGRNLGLDSRSFRLKGGERGNYGLRFEYDELSKLYSDSYQTPYTGMGSTHLTQPAIWTIAPAPTGTTIITTAMMADLAANMKHFNVETRRKATGLGLTKQISGGWDMVMNFKRDEKNGTKLTGAPMQIGGQGNRGTLLAPEPVNYTTDQFDVLARYSGEKLHIQAGYYASLFNNANRSLVFDNLFYNGASTVGGNALTGQLGLAPDNQFHQINASGGYTISDETRLNANLSLGRMTQNEAFLPYSTAGVMPATTSLNGRVNTAHADIKLSSKLTQEFNFTAGYKYDDRDNRTPVNTYTYQNADITAAPGLANTRRNTPHSNTRQGVNADMDYRLSAATRLRLGYDYEQVKHTYEPTTGDREHTVKADVKHNFSDTTSGGLSYAYSDRKASAYDGAAPLMSTYTATYLASLCAAGNSFLYNGVVTPCTSTTALITTPFLDTPALRKFFLADRKRDKLNAFANIAADENLDLQFGASYYRERYPDTEAGFGLTLARGWAVNFDANLAATDTVSGSFFTSYESYKTHQNGHNGSSNAASPVITTVDRQNNAAAFDPLTGQVSIIDRSLTAGLGFRVRPGGSFEWGGDFTHANTTGSTKFRNLGSVLLANILPVPDTVSRLSRLELFGKYQIQKDLALNVKYAHEKYNSTDWAWDGQTLTSSTSFIGSGQVSPDYSVNMISASLSYRF